MQILIQTDSKTRVPRDVDAATRAELAKKFTIYDVTGGVVGPAVGPTDPDLPPVKAGGLPVMSAAQAGVQNPDGSLPAASFTNTDVTSLKAQVSGYGKARKRTAGARMLSGLTTATAGTSAGSTWHVTAAAGSVPFTHIAPIFQSLETGTITITSCAVAAVDAAGQSGQPTGFPHSSATYVPVTFGGSASGTMPVRIGAEAPSILIGDFTPCRALGANTSGLYYLAIRAYFAGTGYSYRAIANYTGLSGSAGHIEGYSWASSNQVVDGITTPANYTSTTLSTNNVVIGFLTLNDQGGRVGISFGDSTVAGVGSSSGCVSGEALAVYQNANAGTPMSLINAGIPGAEPAKYALFSRNAMVQFGRYLSWASYRVSSINDACNSAAKLEEHWAEALRFVDACQAQGVIPILQTCTPQNLGSVGADVHRKALNDRVRAGTDWMVQDIDAVVADPANSWQYLPAYNSGDNSHPSLAGYQAIAAAIRPGLLSI